MRLVLQDLLLQAFRMGRSALFVDIDAVWIRPDGDDFRLHVGEQAGCQRRDCTVGTIEHDLHAVKALRNSTLQVREVLLSPLQKIQHRSDVLASRTRQRILGSIQILLDLRLHLIRQLEAIASEKFNPIIREGVVRSRNHDTGIRSQSPREIRHSRSRDDTQPDHFRSNREETGQQRALQHLTGDPRIAPDHYLGLAFLSMSGENIPAYAADTKRQLRRQLRIGDSAHTICSEILPHVCPSFLSLYKTAYAQNYLLVISTVTFVMTFLAGFT